VIVLSTVLRTKRMLDGAEIDKITWDVEAPKALAMERQRRADWCKRELAASAFARNVITSIAVATSCPRLDAVISDTFDRKARRRYPA
jgi:hypothetical protein